MAIQFYKRLGELFSSAAITGYYDTTRADVVPYLGAALLPAERTNSTELKSISGKAGPPVVLRTAEFDAVAPIRPRLPLKMMSNEMPFFREGYKIGEKERQELRVALMAGDSFATHIIERIYDDQAGLLLGAEAAAERMRMILLSTGFIQTVIDNVPMDYDYGFNTAEQMTTLTGAAAWDQPDTSDPITDLIDAQEAAGLDGARAIMTLATYRNMIRSSSLLTLKFPGITGNTRILPDEASALVANSANVVLTVLTPEANTFRDRVNGPDMKFFPDGVVTLVPASGTLGKTYRGVTPEEADLMGGEDWDVTVTSDGVAVVTETHPHPVTHETRASQIALPVLDRIDYMHILNVY